MAEKVVLDVEPRTVLGKATKRLRKEGIIPANIYGHHVDPAPVQLKELDFEVLRRHHSIRNVVTLISADKSEQTVLVHHVQHNPVSGQVLHIDFTRIDASERIEIHVPLNFVGDAPGVKVGGGVLLPLVETLAIECAAVDIPDHIDVDITSLTEIDAILHAHDIALPAQYKLITNQDEPVVKVGAPRAEEVVAPAATEEAAATPAAAPASTEE